MGTNGYKYNIIIRSLCTNSIFYLYRLLQRPIQCKQNVNQQTYYRKSFIIRFII